MIKHVRITNYKSLGNVAVDLAPVTVLIGRSGTGKSNFVLALRFLRDYLIHRNDGFFAQDGGWEPVVSATTSRPMTLSLRDSASPALALTASSCSSDGDAIGEPTSTVQEVP